VRVDRAFPNTLAITVLPEHPALVAQSGRSAWLVASDGRVLAPARHPHHLPRAILAAHVALTVGSVAGEHDLSVALRTLSETSAFARHVGGVKQIISQPSLPLTIVLRHGLQVRLGTPDQLGLKLQVAGRVLGRMTSRERHSLAYVDVSAPARPALSYRR
jgi:cell division septal protein FtsQ